MAQEENGKHNGGDVVAAKAAPVFSALRPHLMVEAPKAADAIQFYKRAFGAEEVAKSLHPKRKAEQELPLILHAHLKFGAAEVMVCDETEEAGEEVKSPPQLKGTSVILHLETDDVEGAFEKAVEAGATVTEPISEKPWGQIYGKIKDPFGFVWSIATPVKHESAA